MLNPGCLLKIGVIGLNHKTADLAFRESMAKAAAAFAGEKACFFPHPVVLLSTCNRTEIYFGGDNLAEVHSDLLRTLRQRIPDPFEHRLYSYFGLDCFVHLSQVTAGLDSAIIAETEIQRQVKLAYANAASICSLSACMHYVFQKALKLGKFMRNQLEIERGVPHLFQALWTLSKEIHKQRILLVGHSEVNRNFARFLYQRGVREFSLSTRSPEAVLIQGALPCGREELSRWQSYDLIVCAASSDQYLLSGVGRDSQVIFDLSVPRNVDPKTKNIQLYNIEQLNRWIDQRRGLQLSKIEEALQLLRREVQCMARRYTERDSRVGFGFAGIPAF